MPRKRSHVSSDLGTLRDYSSQMEENPIAAEKRRQQATVSALFTPGAFDLIDTQMQAVAHGLSNLEGIVQNILFDTLELQLLYDEVDRVLNGQTDAINRFLGLMNRVLPPGREAGK